MQLRALGKVRDAGRIVDGTKPIACNRCTASMCTGAEFCPDCRATRRRTLTSTVRDFFGKCLLIRRAAWLRLDAGLW
jgi:hypothetical protein